MQLHQLRVDEERLLCPVCNVDANNCSVYIVHTVYGLVDWILHVSRAVYRFHAFPRRPSDGSSAVLTEDWDGEDV